MSDMTMEQRLALNHYDVDTEAHIKIKPDVCQECDLRPASSLQPLHSSASVFCAGIQAN